MTAPSAGFVSLVGAGPGDPELITVRGMRRLEAADLVLYDALVHPDLLALAHKAHRFFVGKRAGRRAIRQETINRLLIRAARRGKHVVRLKCGDPFVLGRGGEEALALHEAGVAFEVVPGLSTALAAPALANIPVTHRGISSSVAVVSGHAREAWDGTLAALPPNVLTVVVLMGLRARQAIASHLLRHGWRPDTPAAVLWAAGTPAARTWAGSLTELAQLDDAADPEDAPGTLCIGDVVSVRHALERDDHGFATALAR